MRVRLDRRVLVSSLASGGIWLSAPLLVGALPLIVIGGVYVVIASVVLAAAYGRPGRVSGPKRAAWAATWLGAVLVWAATLTPVGFGSSVAATLEAVLVGAVVGTACWVAWQAVALMLRQFVGGSARPER